MDVATNNEYINAYRCLKSCQDGISFEEFARILNALLAMDKQSKEANLLTMEQDARIYPALPDV